MLAVTVIAFALIALTDFPELFQKKETGKIVLLSVLFLTAFVCAMLLCTDVRIPSVIRGIERLLHHARLTFTK